MFHRCDHCCLPGWKHTIGDRCSSCPLFWDYKALESSMNKARNEILEHFVAYYGEDTPHFPEPKKENL